MTIRCSAKLSIALSMAVIGKGGDCLKSNHHAARQFRRRVRAGDSYVETRYSVASSFALAFFFSSPSGKLKQNVDPAPAADSIHIRPP